MGQGSPNVTAVRCWYIAGRTVWGYGNDLAGHQAKPWVESGEKETRVVQSVDRGVGICWRPPDGVFPWGVGISRRPPDSPNSSNTSSHTTLNTLEESCASGFMESGLWMSACIITTSTNLV